MKKWTRLAIATTVVAAAVPAMAQFQKAEDAVRYRQSVSP